MSDTSFHMTPDEFRRHGTELVEWIARYRETVEELPVRSPVAPGEVRAALPAHPPQQPEPFAVAVRKAGGQLVASGRIPVQSIVAALDELDAAEA